ncbi:putative aminoacrylate hydrolase RutD [Streptomyces sp. YIM 130001]|uniref:alpha/beta fold hydrolase n=1 Tax=Streptomyces sp. YIM 130001 TaxID=2259644 RepID=UPI000ED69893|nr:alpha/beta hydrolase [Streptomyces sp. YIM 130001]RII13759.1 putative aminoacrylate hydrolase RutD [Streptomyces sp. YIM 130001]
MRAFTFPKITGAALAATAVAGVTHQIYSSLTSQFYRPPGFEQHRHTCSSGNIITYYRRDGLPGGPTVVFESGLMHTSVAWLLLCEHLDPAISVVVYDRAGYRKSLRRCNVEYNLAESVGDLLDIIARGTDGGPTYVVGHSLGGYLAHRAAERAATEEKDGGRRAIDGIVLIDPTHPQELVVSQSQREGARGTNAAMKLGPVTALFGGGLLVEKGPLFEYCEGSPYYRQLRREASSHAGWVASKREWGYSYRLMLDGGRPLARLSVPVSVIAAEKTVLDLPEQQKLYDEYVASGAGGGSCRTIPGSAHLSITGGVEHAPLTAAAVQEQVTVWAESAVGTGTGTDRTPEVQAR